VQLPLPYAWKVRVIGAPPEFLGHHHFGLARKFGPEWMDDHRGSSLEEHERVVRESLLVKSEGYLPEEVVIKRSRRTISLAVLRV